MSQYLGEFRAEWRAVTSAMVGLSCGLVMNSYAAGIMGPHLIAAFGWSKSALAAVQILALVTVFAFPFVGRLADLVGARRTALIGIIASPILFFAFSQVTSIGMYAAVFGLQVLLLTTTTPPVYCRIVVRHFQQARGMALALAASGPPLVATIFGPLLNLLVVAKGWQAGYYALMVFTLVVGLAAYFLMPADLRDPVELRDGARPSRKRAAREDYALILRTPVFWVLTGSMLLCNLPQAIILTQLNLMIAEHGVVGSAASIMVSAYAMGMLVGRFVSGYALDRFSPRVVATLGLSLSAFGLLAMSFVGGSIIGLALAVLAIGFSFGAESDILGFLIHRHFGTRIYGSVAGMLASTVAISSTLGAGGLSFVLHETNSYRPFLFVTGLCVLVGGLLLLLLPRHGSNIDEAEERADDHADAAGPAHAA